MNRYRREIRIVAALAIVLGTAAVGWSMTPSGMGGAVGRAETFGMGVGLSITGVWMPLLLIGALIGTAWAVWSGRIGAALGRLVIAALIIGGGLIMLNEYFGSASAAELDSPPAQVWPTREETHP
jgi:hypothetical protein